MSTSAALEPARQFAEFEAQLGFVAQEPASDAVSWNDEQAPVSADKPVVILPHGEYRISDAAARLGVLLAQTQRFFLRGGVVVRLGRDKDGWPRLDEAKPAALASDFESVAVMVKMDGEKPKSATCPEQTAKLISASVAFREALPPIHVLTRCPVLIERAGRLIQISGYDRESGIFAGEEPAEPMELAVARRLLWEALDGFHFATPADRTRALAAMITPTLVFGGLLKGRAPVDLGEADVSQTGKGYRNRLTAAIYAQSLITVTQQRGGVGSMEETFNTALIRGANFIVLDNVRGKLDSPSVESFLTEEVYMARAPYREPVEIDPRRVVVMLTSNKADMTTDMANRSCCVRILKQPENYLFKSYPEGDILDHVRAQQPRYLGAVFAVVQAWHAAGCPKTAEARHTFRPWGPTLDWITRNLLEAGPLLDGHRETQARMTNPVLNWLRDVAINVLHSGRGGFWLRASDLIDILAETGTEVPGLSEQADVSDTDVRKVAQQATGRRMGLCFRTGDRVNLDGMTVERREQYCEEGRYTIREYCFTAAASPGTSIAANPATESAAPPPTTPEKRPCGYSRGYAAASPAAMKSLCAANAADLSQQCQTFLPEVGGWQDIVSIGTHSRIAATAAGEASDDFEEGVL